MKRSASRMARVSPNGLAGSGMGTRGGFQRLGPHVPQASLELGVLVWIDVLDPRSNSAICPRRKSLYSTSICTFCVRLIPAANSSTRAGSCRKQKVVSSSSLNAAISSSRTVAVLKAGCGGGGGGGGGAVESSGLRRLRRPTASPHDLGKLGFRIPLAGQVGVGQHGDAHRQVAGLAQHRDGALARPPGPGLRQDLLVHRPVRLPGRPGSAPAACGGWSQRRSPC